jgi:hypothetical protein
MYVELEYMSDVSKVMIKRCLLSTMIFNLVQESIDTIVQEDNTNDSRCIITKYNTELTASLRQPDFTSHKETVP